MSDAGRSGDRAERGVRLLGVRIDPVSRGDLVRFVVDAVAQRRRALLAYVNVHAIDLAQRDEPLREYLERADLAFCDGYGVRWGAKLVGKDVGARHTPPDWIDELCRACCERGSSLYLLGAAAGVSEAAAQALRARHPGLRIAGTHHGYFDKERESAGTQAVVAAVNAARPDVLLVGFGMPGQERWLSENWGRLTALVGIPVGAMFDYVGGALPRGPRWMTDRGLEWMLRLFAEPRRLWRRYLIGNPAFLWRLLVGGRS